MSSVSSHGGAPATWSNTTLTSAGGLVRDQDLHVCPIPGHGTTPFRSSATETADGRPVVRCFVDAAGCGAVLTTGQPGVLAA